MGKVDFVNRDLCMGMEATLKTESQQKRMLDFMKSKEKKIRRTDGNADANIQRGITTGMI